MSNEAWIMIFGIAIANLFTLTGGLVHIAGRLMKIEADIKWIKAGCQQCPQSSDQNSP